MKVNHGLVCPNMLIGRLEIEMFNRRFSRKQTTELLSIPTRRFSNLLNGKTGVSMSLTKNLY